MSAGTITWAKRSLSRAGTSPAPLGRAPSVGAAAGAPFAFPPPLPGAGAGPFFGCFWVGASALAMALALVDGFAAALAGAHLAPVPEDLGPRPDGAVAAVAHDEDVRERQRPFPLDDAALPQLLG